MGTRVASAVGSTILTSDHNQQSAAAAGDDDNDFHVMAVDDSIIDRKLIERLLKTSSYRVTTVDSGNKALQLLLGLQEDGDYQDEHNVSLHYHHRRHQEMEQVNMIITDYWMPGLTGYELLRKIKESEYLKDIPVVIMSSEYVPSRINRCLEEGAEEFILKPVQMSDMSKLKPHLFRFRPPTTNTNHPPKTTTAPPPNEDEQQQLTLH